MYNPYGNYYPQNNMRSPLPQVQPAVAPQAYQQEQAAQFRIIPVANPEDIRLSIRRQASILSFISSFPSGAA